jgi:hypothetical protein
MKILSLIFGTVLATSTALAQSITPGAGPVSELFFNGATSSNGADLTEDTLTTCVYNLPANTLVNVGDRVRVFAGGTAGATTDNKSAKLRVGGGAPGIIASVPLNAAAQIKWSIYAEIAKTGASTQRTGMITVSGNTGAPDGFIDTTVTDTAIIPISITGQNPTNAVAGSVTCGYMTVELIRAPGT